MKKILAKIAGVVTMFAMTFGVALATPPGQITFCHVPPGNDGNPQTITTNINGWLNGHNGGIGEAHGLDYIGPCQGDNGGDDDDDSDDDDDTEEPVCEEGNLLVNGGFESPDVAAGNWTIFDDGTSGLGWDVQWNGAFVGAPATAKLEIHDSLWTPVAEGSQYAELDADWGYNNGEEASIVISQDIATIPGYEYNLGYDFSPRPGTNIGDNMLGVFVEGANVANHSTDGSANSGNSWTHYDYSFVATEATTTIAFKDMGTPNSLGTLLDNVSVDCQGEPDDTCESYEVLYARVKFSKISNGGDINGWRNWGPGADMAPKVFVGGSAPANEYDDEEWFPLTNPDGSFINDADISGYSDVPGVAVERMEGKIRLVLYGFHTTENYEYGGKELAAGVIEIGSQTTWQAGLQSPLDWSNLNTNTRTHDPLINDASNPMDSRGSFVGYINQFNERFDRVRTFAPDKFQFHLVATTGSDGFYSSYEEPELDCLEGEIDPQ